jgi:folate-binding Fe-S cluster repair protein YgfZ
LHLVDDGSCAWITVEPGTAVALRGWLEKMRFMLRVEVADVTDAWAVVGAAPALAAQLGGQAPRWLDPWPALGETSASYAAVDEARHPGRERAFTEVLLPREQLPALSASVALAGTWRRRRPRVAAWRPRLGFETDHRTIPHEGRLAAALPCTCRRAATGGRRTVARVHNLGRPPRRLVFLHLDGSEHTLPPRTASP